MNISTAYTTGLYRTQGLQPTHYGLSSHKSTDTLTTTAGGTADKVTISSEALAISNAELESCRLPDWVTDFAPEFNILNGNAVEEGREFMKYHDQLAADGVISARDEAALQTYIKNMPETQRRKDLEIDRNKNLALYEEFGQIHKKHTDQSLAELGIVTQDDWQTKIMKNEEVNQQLRHSIMQKMFDDPRAVELMDQLYIRKPDIHKPDINRPA